MLGTTEIEHKTILAVIIPKKKLKEFSTLVILKLPHLKPKI